MASTNIPSSIGEHLQQFQQTLLDRQKYVKNEYQAYGLELAKELNDWGHRSLYIRLSKVLPRKLLEAARYFVKDQNQGTIKTPAKLFMWKLKELKNPTIVDKTKSE